MSRSLIIPVENQFRELDAKLLLALVAAREGFTSVIGSRLELDFYLPALPRSIYLAKSMTARSLKMFRIMTLLGHQVAAWDEEALIHPPDAAYFSRRLDKDSITFVKHLFAWGADNAALWHRYPELPEEIEIHLTGNPRGDMLRPELAGFFAAETAARRREHGDFLLINTNFSFVNSFYPDQGLLQTGKTDADDRPLYGRAAVGMEREFVERLQQHKENIFRSFQELIPQLAAAFPELTIIVRPHPVENPSVYHDIAARCRGVKVINEGNVIPWLRAAKAVVHNGCTTGVEAYMLGMPALSYQVAVDTRLDDGFYQLANRLSHQCFSFSELQERLEEIVGGRLGAAAGIEREELMAKYLASQGGPLACELIVKRLKDIAAGIKCQPAVPLSRRLQGHGRGLWRRFNKRFKARLPNSKYRPEFQRHRYPGLTPEELQIKLDRLRQSLGEATMPAAEVKFLNQFIFRISP